MRIRCGPARTLPRVRGGETGYFTWDLYGAVRYPATGPGPFRVVFFAFPSRRSARPPRAPTIKKRGDGSRPDLAWRAPPAHPGDSRDTNLRLRRRKTEGLRSSRWSETPSRRPKSRSIFLLERPDGGLVSGRRRDLRRQAWTSPSRQATGLCRKRSQLSAWTMQNADGNVLYRF